MIALRLAIAVLCSVSLSFGQEFLRLSQAEAKRIVLANRASGQVGKTFDFRVTATDRSYNFKLRATWMTPAVIEARARLEQISRALTDLETKRLVEKALSAGEIVIQVEIDPREGSGVIPADWIGLLGPKGTPPAGSRLVRGKTVPDLRENPALTPVAPRDYSYELFWLVFSTTAEDGKPVFTASDKEAELSVRIQGKVGKVSWPVPGYLFRR